MKLFSLLATTLAAVALGSCSNDEMLEDGAVAAGEGNVTITLSAPEALATRGMKPLVQKSSALGGITNCDSTVYDLRYQLAIYSEDGQAQYIAPMVQTVNAYHSVTYTLRLTAGRKYKVVAWADFTLDNAPEADLHYNTTKLDAITCLDTADKHLNDESRDAYFITTDIDVTSKGVDTELMLRRPFAKVRVVTTDWDKDEPGAMPDHFAVTYKNCKRFTSMNAVTGDATGADITAPVDYTASFDKAVKDYALSYDTQDTCRTLTVDFLMVDRDEQAIHMNFKALNGTEEMISKDIETDIPIRRNYLTTLVGNLLGAICKIRLSCLEEFEDEWVQGQTWWAPTSFTPVKPGKGADGWYHVTNENEFWWFSNPANINDGDKIKLDADIDLNNVPFAGIGKGNLKYVEVDGQNHLISNVTINHTGAGEGVGVFSTLYDQSVVKNVRFRDITINGQYGSAGHTAETALSAGCVGFLRGSMENCHAENVCINGKPEKEGTPTDRNLQNLGGLIGFWDNNANLSVKNCTVKHVFIHANRQAGGLIGSIGDQDNQIIIMGHVIGQGNATTTTNRLIENCSADGVFIHNTINSVERNYEFLGHIVTGGLSALVGSAVHGFGLTIRNCSVTDDFCVYYPDATENTVFMDYMRDHEKTYISNHIIGYVAIQEDDLTVEP